MYLRALQGSGNVLVLEITRYVDIFPQNYLGSHLLQFFVNFVFWAALFCLWVFATVLVFVVKEGASPDGNFDIQEIVIVAL